jgi:hypothetical protein
MTTPVPEELITITGYRQKGAQARWLKGQKIQHRLNAYGHPVVSRAYWEQSTGQPKRSDKQSPNLDALGATA